MPIPPVRPISTGWSFQHYVCVLAGTIPPCMPPSGQYAEKPAHLVKVRAKDRATVSAVRQPQMQDGLPCSPTSPQPTATPNPGPPLPAQEGQKGHGQRSREQGAGSREPGRQTSNRILSFNQPCEQQITSPLELKAAAALHIAVDTMPRKPRGANHKMR